MRSIDRLAYGNRLARLHPAWKTGCSLGAIAVALVASRVDVSLLLLALMVGLSVVWAGIPARTVLRLVTGEAGLLALTVAGVAIGASTASFPGSVAIGPLWFGTSSAMLGTAAVLVTRALACVAAMNFLAMTTPVTAIVDMLRSWHVSETLLDLATLIYRFVFVLLDTLGRMVTASDARLGFRDGRTALHTSGRIGAGLFVEAFRRSRHLEDALRARGWQGPLRVLPDAYEHPGWARAVVARLAR